MRRSKAAADLARCSGGGQGARNPAPKLFYVVTLEQCDIIVASAKEPAPASGFRGTGNEGIPTEPGKFYLRALDLLTGDIKWEYPMPGPGIMWAGTVSTAGGVIFSGDDDGNLVAVDARTGKDLWHFSTGQSLFTSPVTYMADGKQVGQYSMSGALPRLKPGHYLMVVSNPGFERQEVDLELKRGHRMPVLVPMRLRNSYDARRWRRNARASRPIPAAANVAGSGTAAVLFIVAEIVMKLP